METTQTTTRVKGWHLTGRIASAGILIAGVTAGIVAAGPNAASAATYESSPVGFASMNGGTTGGTGGTTVTVTTASALDTYLQASGKYIIKVSGMISTSGMHKVAANKTIQGVGSSSGLNGGGLNIASVSNVIVRNMIFKNADDDSINVQYSTNVWIDHNDLSNGYDGLVDIKRASDYITVSWNHTHDHDKDMLLGHDDANSAEDLGHLRVTYVHNYFDGTVQRNPRVRFGNPVHVLNNYFIGNSGYGVATTCNAGVLIERNYFENVPNSVVTQTGDSPAGYDKLINNILVNSGTPETNVGANVAAIPYSYTPEANSTVKATVTAGAGVGKLGL
jgi:pectate lyase